MAFNDESGLNKILTLAGMAVWAFIFILALYSLFDAATALSMMGTSKASLNNVIAPGFIGVLLFLFLIYVTARKLVGRQIEIKLEKDEFAIGEGIKGTICLKLDKPTKARSLKVFFFGLHNYGQYTSIICQNDITASPGRIFIRGESFDFTIPVPEEAENYFSQGFPFKPRWYVKAKLDMPGKVDIQNEARIKITENNNAKEYLRKKASVLRK